MTQPVVIQMRH